MDGRYNSSAVEMLYRPARTGSFSLSFGCTFICTSSTILAAQQRTPEISSPFNSHHPCAVHRCFTYRTQVSACSCTVSLRHQILNPPLMWTPPMISSWICSLRRAGAYPSRCRLNGTCHTCAPYHRRLFQRIRRRRRVRHPSHPLQARVIVRR